VLAALTAFPEGLTTAEAASVMRPSDLVDADIESTAAALAEAEAEGAVIREPAGVDAIWRTAGSEGGRSVGVGRERADSQTKVAPPPAVSAGRSAAHRSG
jgi:hypothetical protein